MKKLITYLFIITAAGFTACKKNSVTPDEGTDNTTTPLTKIAPDGFNFATSKNITLNLTLKATNEQPLGGVIVSVYDPANTSVNASIYKGVTDNNGNLTAVISVPASFTKIVIDPAYLGLMHLATANISGSTVTATIGGAKGFGGDIVPQVITVSSDNTLTTLSNSSINFTYPSPYTATSNAVLNTSDVPLSYGVPKYLEATGDVVGPTILTNVNASLPESKPLTTTHAEYLSSTAVSTLNITERANVWITYVAEGAGNLNSLAFYTYTTGNPPKSESDIKNAMLVFPNASGLGSGGGLKPGDKVKIGTFDANTSIGFILLGNAWTGKGVNTNADMYFSDAALNPENTAALRKHTVVLYDAINKLTLIGFEDLNREGSSDNDFNDLVFYATSDPVKAISTTGVSPVTQSNDSDGDGVINELDAFPTDPKRAYISYFPSASTYANIAFEDNWPTKGDYDMNDLVVKYRYTFISDASNKVVSIQGDYMVNAAGASFKNGFGVQFPFAASSVFSVSGQMRKDNYITFASNGVEAGQTKAVIIPFDNHDVLASNQDGSFFINTLNAKAKVSSATASVLVTLTNPIDLSSLSPASFNPFLISNERRGYEIHLPGYAPTDKADTKLFGTGDDTSAPSSGKYYISKENWPWAISFNDSFVYPLELTKITDAYPHFAEWAASGGLTYTDWYSNIATGYRATPNLYTK